MKDKKRPSGLKLALWSALVIALTVLLGTVITAINLSNAVPPSEDRVADIVEHTQRPGINTLYMHELGDNGVDA